MRTDRQTDRHTDMTTLVATFGNNIIIIIIFITCDWVDTRWQGSFFTYYIIYVRTMKVDYLRV